MHKSVIFFDTETNGLGKNDSVLSISALKASFDDEALDYAAPGGGGGALFDDACGTIEDNYERFYFRMPGERFGAGAVRVNGLTDDVIAEKRASCDYPLHFCDDIDSFARFCGDSRHLVAHNILYDTQYLSADLLRRLPHRFCTMQENKNIIKARRQNGDLKSPNLGEAARFYGISLDSGKLHGSGYDTYLVHAIFCKMLSGTGKARRLVVNFLRQE